MDILSGAVTLLFLYLCRRGELYILTRRQLIKLMFIKRVSYKQNETCKTMTNIYISDRDNAKMNILLFDI